ncbi:Oxygen-evolving enhancer protein 3-1, chloroplastic [Triticum urartu]|uniref:Oxygen-evolving enhancer protein 3-1, chloroplastic n=1 Tax=Triticum urartu TaxID=4572 RepID=M8APX0_TRIUA|nr:Oxygen-evolving enhancer protein 3-1, chloroplastic [Triticum urartu]
MDAPNSDDDNLVEDMDGEDTDPKTGGAGVAMGLGAVDDGADGNDETDDGEPGHDGEEDLGRLPHAENALDDFLHWGGLASPLPEAGARCSGWRWSLHGPAKEINNGETGTRSFVKNGIYMADIGPSFAAHAYRVRSSAFDLLALEDLLGKEASNYVNKYLRLKATFIYYDFDKLITTADLDAKPPLLGLANRLFDSFEKLQAAVTTKDDADIGSCYADTKLILQEVMTRMA